MGKQNKDDIPNPSRVANRDIIQRLNFLYQASVLLNGMTAGPSSQVLFSTCETDDTQDPPKERQKRVVSTADLSRSYIDTMKIVGQKTTVKIDPTVKRVICKGCRIVLIPGASSTVRVKNSKSHGHLVIHTCNSCRTSRRIPAPPVLDTNEPESKSTTTNQPAPGAATGSASRSAQDRQKRPRGRRLAPHFARDLGHVVFRGNERLPDTIL
ncbi:RNAse P Rpr2/Rpp21/SNM1 subunit domain-containing protein [Suillus subaureus]|uniref:RNAse P Rpr2/Rpp21/SNM1 subunit domain-containing protein n=1 Tax=Suillus subaureus TaxID=48587 RepID=A0A9P7J9A9_9AGAM|nr:RNAse P Rpr2/Rpp21/SNM1 subunit domain-containing protein [Suillus subaureus]KAG1809428.1 RNAse P Rpr2/Rpp21/SNM1 subunit domain-containing protein [Suillus subaureus]